MNEHQIPLLPFDPCPDLAEYIRANLPRQVAKANTRQPLRTEPRPSNVAGYIHETTRHLREKANG
jgi:hypothetical protein